MPITLTVQPLAQLAQPSLQAPPEYPASDLDFAAILTAVRKGDTITQTQSYAWEMHKMAAGEYGNLALDEIQMAGMIRGFKMEFPEGYPPDLKQRLEQTWSECKTVEDRYAFVNMYTGTFDPNIGKSIGLSWGLNWRQRLKSTIQANEGLASGLNSFSAKGTHEMDSWLKRILGIA